jgi:hypothetical protein
VIIALTSSFSYGATFEYSVESIEEVFFSKQIVLV